MADQSQPEIQDDIIWIAREVGLDRGATYRLLSHGLLPAKRVGRKWVASCDQLRRALTGEQAGGLE
jgi:hypothetical protein